jgi:hypothetical protein
MPTKYDLKEVFQSAFDLKPEDSIVIPCRDFRETERIRNALYREVSKLRKISSDLADEIRIKRVINGSNYAIILSRVPGRVNTAFLITGDGKIQEVSKDKDRELDRIEKLMREDGYSEEEIKDYKASEANSIPQMEKEEQDEAKP